MELTTKCEVTGIFAVQEMKKNIIVAWHRVKLIARKQYYNIKHIAKTIYSIPEFQKVAYKIN